MKRLTLALLAMLMLPVVGFHAAVLCLPFHETPTSPESTLLLDRNGSALLASAAYDGQWRFPLSADQINPDLVNAIVAIEDARFYDHAGVDWRCVVGAAWEDLRHFSIRRGASTLTMQLARLRDPRPRTFLGKLDQAIRAEQIEGRSDKRTIVVEYLNAAGFGGNLVGAGAASWRYFGKPCAQLSLAQCALLAGLPQNPNHLRPDRFPQRAKARRDRVLDRMLELRLISRSRRDHAIAEPIDAHWLPLPQNAPGLRDAAVCPLLTIAADHRGQTIRTTIDPTIAHQAVRAAKQRLEQLDSSDVDSIAAVVLDTKTGQLLAAVSLSHTAPDVDLTQSRRSTGSTLKPFIYAAAFDAGVCAPQTLLNDAPVAWPGYEPANYDRQFRGELTAAEALAASRNLPAMTVLSRVGVPRCIEVMSAIGLRTLSRTPDRYGLPLAIGGAEASPMELAEAYATLARGGEHRGITVITDHSSEQHKSESSIVACASGPCERAPHGPEAHVTSGAPLLLPDACFAALGAIADPDRTGQLCPEARLSNVAWKTGTSSGHRDAWCAAVTRRYTIVVWLGNAIGKGSAALVGADAAAPVALSLIAAIDPIDMPWPEANLHESPARMRSTNTALAIVSPINGSELLVNEDHQRSIEFRGSSQGSAPWWFVDGTPIGSGERVAWPPTPGKHEIRLVDSTGHSAVSRIRVR